ncbi:hypothetical protein UPYG_G00265210 [Umbra pygmaea]|uniref:Uncharacterized protein n=1 Tax=Umbra pygmaea TaxID=75934 RepID=A0ABD0WEU6_UMBPY
MQDAAANRYWTEREKHRSLDNPDTSSARDAQRRRRRRQRQALASRLKELTSEEKLRFTGATGDMMSDVETDPEDPSGFLVTSPRWRSSELEDLIKVADQRRRAKRTHREKRRRQNEKHSARPLPPQPYPAHLTVDV